MTTGSDGARFDIQSISAKQYLLSLKNGKFDLLYFFKINCEQAKISTLDTKYIGTKWHK